MTVYPTFLFAFWCTGFVGIKRLTPHFLNHFHATLSVTVLKQPVVSLTNPPQLTLYFPIVEGFTDYVWV